MPLKKKGTSEKIEILKESEERFRHLLEEAKSFGGELGKGITLTNLKAKKTDKKKSSK